LGMMSASTPFIPRWGALSLAVAFVRHMGCAVDPHGPMDDTGKRPESIPFAARVRASLAAQKLPTELPVKVWIGLGGRDACSGCETPILRAQILYSLETPDNGMYSLHAGCYGLWLGELIRQGLWKPDPPPNSKVRRL
jgi:hypothetical protein